MPSREPSGVVASGEASQEVNAAYMQDLRKAFVDDFPSADVTARIKVDLFDIRSSVLDFIEPISNFDIQLKKHFRSYPEMISFSSKYYYVNGLQVMKIRGKPIEDVIEFEPIEHDGYLDKRNANEPETQKIIDRIEKLLDLTPAPTVGVITPHTEQQASTPNLFGQGGEAMSAMGQERTQEATPFSSRSRWPDRFVISLSLC